MPSSTLALAAPTPSTLALENSRFANWFPHYRRFSPKATVIDVLALQPDFLDWLEEDGIVLPLDSDDHPVGSRNSTEGDRDSPESAQEDDDEDDEGEDEVQPRNFHELNQRIRQIIDQYEGAVFPKLDWSAPLDAAFMVPGATLRCTEPSDVYLLLKSSDFVSKDVVQLGELGRMTGHDTIVRPHLVLKKFFNMPSAHEFRCFVRAGRLVCISQRDVGTFFEHLQSEAATMSIRQKLLGFFEAVLAPTSESTEKEHRSSPVRPFPIPDFVWDAYLTRDMSRVMIVDINPYVERTDGLLWQWDEVEEEAKRLIFYPSSTHPLPALRLVTSRAQTTQSFPTYAHNMMPSDVVGISQGADIANFARSFNEQLAHAVFPLPSASSSQSREVEPLDVERPTDDDVAADVNEPGR